MTPNTLDLGRPIKPPLIRIEDHDSDHTYRSRYRPKECDSPRLGSRCRPRKIREDTKILLLEELEQNAEDSPGADELLRYAKELMILKDPALGGFFIKIPWSVKSVPVSQVILPEHRQHSGHYEWIGKDTHATPKYLWDSHNDCTVNATEERLKVGYVAVSWTWGRYQEQSNGVPLERTSKGVGAFGRKWKVPQLPCGPDGNHLLHDLKACLKSIEAYRYFWVDLLCINQNKAYEKRQEIAKQAGIFGGALGTLCYLWQQEKPEDLTEALTGVGRLLNWALVFADGSVLSTDDSQSVEHEFPQGSARHNKEAYHSRFGHLKDDHWFSSLWALQEIVLAPAGIWMTRYGDMCKVNGQILTTRLMAIIVRLLSWAAFTREEIWDKTRQQSSFSAKDWESVSRSQRKQDEEVREKLSQAFEDLSQTWQSRTIKPTQLWSRLQPQSALPFLRRWLPATVNDGYQGLVVEADNTEQLDAHWLYTRYRREQGLRDEIRKWTKWSFGHACIDVSLPTTRTAIIVAGAERSVMEGHGQNRQIALMAALKVEPPEWFSRGFEPPKEVLAQVSRHHLNPLLLNLILKTEGRNERGPLLFNVMHNLPRRTTDGSDMNDFDETEWDHTEFEVDYILEEEMVVDADSTFQALSMRTDRPVQRMKYKFRGSDRYVEVLSGGTSNLTDMLPDSASMINQQVLDFPNGSTIQWNPSEGWHMHRDGILHLPYKTRIQQIGTRNNHKPNGSFRVWIKPNGSHDTQYEVSSYHGLRSICKTQPWLLDALGRKHDRGTQMPQFRFLPLGQYPRRSSSRSPSPSPHSEASAGSSEDMETIGVVLVAEADPSHLSSTIGRHLSRAPQPSRELGSTRDVWHKFGSYRSIGLRTELSKEPEGFFVVSYNMRKSVGDESRADCEQLQNYMLLS